MSDEPDSAASAPVADLAVAPEQPKGRKPKGPKAAGGKKGFNLVLLLVPVALVAALVLSYTLPPSHTFLVNGPLKPLFARFGAQSRPALLAAGAKPTTDPAADIKRLNDEVAAGRKDAAVKAVKIAQLQSQIDGLQAPAASPSASPKPSATPVSDDVKRAANYWVGMDPDKAADIIKALPDAYVKNVFGQMPPDAVADIMSALPAKTAARLTIDSDARTP